MLPVRLGVLSAFAFLLPTYGADLKLEDFGRGCLIQDLKSRGLPQDTLVILGGEFGRTPDVEDKVHFHDLHATILNQLGLDHKRLTYRYSGRDFRLTDVEGEVVRKIIA